jgi:GNAT superfamily N-acetyltransferase
MSISWRIAAFDDADELSTLVNCAYRGDSSRRGWTNEADLLGGQRIDPHSLRELISGLGNVILAFERDRQLVACVWLQKRESSAHLGLLSVQPRAQGTGIGRTVLLTAEAWVAREWRVPRIEMRVIHKRLELIAWYERRGYRATGRREAFPSAANSVMLAEPADLELIILAKVLLGSES